MFEFLYLILFVISILAISLFEFAVRRESWRKTLLVSLVLLALGGTISSIAYEVERGAIMNIQKKQVDLIHEELKKTSRDLTTLNEKLNVIQRIASRNPRDSCRISRIMEEADRELSRSIEDSTKFVRLIIFDERTGKAIANAEVQTVIEQPMGKMVKLSPSYSDSKGVVSLRISRELLEGKLFLRIQHPDFETSMTLASVSQIPNIWEIRLRP